MARSVIVTGGFGVLGKAVAEAFACLGDKVARIDIGRSAAPQAASLLDLGNVDLTDSSATQSAVDEVTRLHGSVDVLVNVAGGFAWETLQDGSLETWERMHALNLRTLATITHKVLPLLRASAAGRVVNIGAYAALQAGAGMGAYAASKAGVHRLTEALAEELSDTAVTVNALLPTIINTPANRIAMPDADHASWVEPAAIASVVVFLASQEARAISGALIPVTRGGEQEHRGRPPEVG
jgi:NAD(P)-dependent dehydrogenase (short-subunit alcohol dehydrogenase family)